jgi:hypothetical protein
VVPSALRQLNTEDCVVETAAPSSPTSPVPPTVEERIATFLVNYRGDNTLIVNLLEEAALEIRNLKHRLETMAVPRGFYR